jgi:hypothetical protein
MAQVASNDVGRETPCNANLCRKASEDQESWAIACSLSHVLSAALEFPLSTSLSPYKHTSCRRDGMISTRQPKGAGRKHSTMIHIPRSRFNDADKRSKASLSRTWPTLKTRLPSRKQLAKLSGLLKDDDAHNEFSASKRTCISLRSHPVPYRRSRRCCECPGPALGPPVASIDRLRVRLLIYTCTLNWPSISPHQAPMTAPRSCLTAVTACTLARRTHFAVPSRFRSTRMRQCRDMPRRTVQQAVVARHPRTRPIPDHCHRNTAPKRALT